MTEAIYYSSQRLSNKKALQISAGVLQYSQKNIELECGKGGKCEQ